jgi:cell division protein ZapE
MFAILPEPDKVCSPCHPAFYQRPLYFMKLSPIECYQQSLAQQGFVADPAQQMAVEKLQKLYKNLIARGDTPLKKSLFEKLRLSKAGPVEPVIGLYFWGGVGRGKTFLMDVFYEALPMDRKLRVHFHRFMRRVHQELKSLQGQKNPLETVADHIAEEAAVLCFDEFFVSDIADAMILGTLMQHLFDRGVTLVATSNIAPDGLYENGLQRSRFLPAIALIKEFTEVINVDGGVDYRLRALSQAELYHTPLDVEADKSLKRSFESLVPDPAHINAGTTELEVEGRILRPRCLADSVAWFDFSELCDGPRSQNDYIELARIFHTVLISNIPLLKDAQNDQARRFINLVDEFYDHNVKLVISAEASPERLYQGTGLDFEFQRTISRLLEMQSHEYLARQHEP